jgi:SAM-dependent methyltransferase
VALGPFGMTRHIIIVMRHEDIYQHGLKKYGESPQAMHWSDYSAQALRFKPLVSSLDLEGKSILDAGCGFGDLLPFLYTRADNFDYLGVDSNKDFIKVAKKRYLGHRFQVGDPFAKKGRAQFDVVLTSGTLNQNVSDWMAQRQKMITNLFSLTNQVLAFNMAGGFHPIPSASVIAYADANEILQFCLSLTTKVTIRADYLNTDFTVIMSR